MISKILIGDIFKSKAQTLINTVNCVGIMGKGIALEYKKQFPEMYKEYKTKCELKKVLPGEPYLYETIISPMIINFPTKNHWRSGSKFSDIEKGLEIIVNNYKSWGVTSLAVPPLGCGNGQLDWSAVGPLIYSKLKGIDIPVEIYAPFGTSPQKLTENFLRETQVSKIIRRKEEKITPELLVLIEIVYQIYKNECHNPIGRTIFQKIAYVATEQGLSTNFKFAQESYGPYSQDVKNVIAEFANANLIIERKLGNMFELQPDSQYESVRKQNFNKISKYQKIIDKTTSLFLRMDTNQAEIATTIFYSARQLKKTKQKKIISEKDVLKYVMEWKKNRRPSLEKTDVADAIRNLGKLRWLNVNFSKELPVTTEF